MDDRIEQAIALFIGTMSSVVLMWGNYRWGGRKRRDEIDDERRHHHDDED